MGRRNLSRFFYASPEKLRRARFSFDPEEERHLVRSLRLGDDAEVRVVDGEGRGATVRLVRGGKGGWEAEVIDRFDSPVEPALRVTLAFGLLKAKGTDEVVERAAEMGATALLPFLSARSVPRWDGSKEERNRERLARIAREGMKVAGGAVAPRIEPIASMAALVEEVRRRGAALLCSLGAEDPLVPRAGPGEALLIVGPEGGLERGEEEALIGAGALSVSLGKRNLRAVTAATTALARLLAGPKEGASEGKRGKNAQNG
ncbi:MAG: RsmE family RNA methyltransferase [Candidatus Eisenbacteria bacterium]|nr:RsmE family RNA methyltransferase [Candidatus Eisenbacteria bacterium]